MTRALLIALLMASPLVANAKQPPVVSPIFGESGEVTFQVAAKKAQSVELSGEMVDGRVKLEKGENGIWSVTLTDLEPGLYGYSFQIDGFQTLDPGNPALKPMRAPRTSVLHIPNTEAPAPYDFRPEIAHGTVHQHGYFSEPIQRYRELTVYTPPGYETSTESYPLLVLQHGHSDAGSTWTAYGKAHWILDALIADGKAQPMIVIMLDGHPIPESFGSGRNPDNTEELRKDLMEAALPMAEKLYRVKEGRDNRAIAGLSMGGMHSLTIGLNELETFSTIASFSGAMPEAPAVAEAFENADKTNEALDLLWIACGKKDFLLDENLEAVERLKAAQIDHEWHLTEGSHSWPVWRGYLADFAPRLFQD